MSIVIDDNIGIEPGIHFPSKLSGVYYSRKPPALDPLLHIISPDNTQSQQKCLVTLPPNTYKHLPTNPPGPIIRLHPRSPLFMYRSTAPCQFDIWGRGTCQALLPQLLLTKLAPSIGLKSRRWIGGPGSSLPFFFLLGFLLRPRLRKQQSLISDERMLGDCPSCCGGSEGWEPFEGVIFTGGNWERGIGVGRGGEANGDGGEVVVRGCLETWG